ncbi:MAG: glucose 1-dehydrogenase [Sphingobium sp.]|uniref:SDR family NAD(P)-dependent oxidoreductase n=1 Tax=Sphingobium sp. TaxID=1912891 RepID=UPI0029A2898F|nr:glucose 1-dehydrogenase [Sphingobium sp.]MDX3909552.1 glucose 1-dehydrogenase [Sphingobium sp.]
MALNFSLSGKTALITGASAGLGAHFAKVLAQNGARVILAARRVDALDQVATDIAAAHGAVSTVALDVTVPDSIAALADVLAGTDILVNNAGVVREKPVLDQTEADWDAVIDTNLKGMFLMAQAAARAMKESGRGGNIINVASILGFRQGGALLPYAVSKAGVIQMTKQLALELARFGIRVNALAPGYVKTDLNRDFWESDAGKTMIKRIPQRRIGEFPDLDGPLLLLASDSSAYMTGSAITVDGGHLVSSL